jgi:PDZ domain-containing protein
MVRRLLAPLAVGFLTALILVAAVGLYASRTYSDSFLYLPDPAQPVAPVVSVEKEAKDPPPDAPGVLFVAVTRRRATLLESWFSGARERGAELVPEEAVLPNGQTPEQRQAEDQADMSQSQRVAAAVAQRALGKDVQITADGARVESVLADSPAASAGLLPGDVIVEAGGEPVDGVGELRTVLADVKPGDHVALKIRRGTDDTKPVDSGTQASTDDPKRAVMGVAVEDDAEIQLPVPVQYSTKSIGGPSAGLPFALEIYNALDNRSLARGHRIAATGTISLDGAVGEIGAAEQKAIGAYEAGADVFLVPAGNLAAAKKYAPEELRIIPVRTFDEALAAIRALPPLDTPSQQAAR